MSATKTTEQAVSPATSRSTDRLEHNAADQWLRGEISLGKMIHIFGVGRPTGDDMAGAIANSFRDRIRQVVDHLEGEMRKEEMEYEREKAENKMLDASATAGAIRAYAECLSWLRYKLGHVL